jgi:Holliday junction resolvase
MTNSNQKGSAAERKLVNLLDAGGFATMRAPASGAATERELPDVIAGNGDVFYVFEAKRFSGKRAYLTAEEVSDLQFFAVKFGAQAGIAVRPDIENGDPAYSNDDMSGWYLLWLDQLRETDGGNYAAEKETAMSEGVALEDVLD